jgi:hypothetical protein
MPCCERHDQADDLMATAQATGRTVTIVSNNSSAAIGVYRLFAVEGVVGSGVSVPG